MTPPKEPCSRERRRTVGGSKRVYRMLLQAYPREFRDEYGDEMTRCFQDLCQEKLKDGGGLSLAALWLHTLLELLYTALEERSTMLVRNVYRSVVGSSLATALILLIPLLAAPAWTLFDFIFAGALIFGTGLTYVLVTKGGNVVYRAAMGIALAAAFTLVWLTGAVGIIGSEDNPANLMYGGVVVVGVIGVLIARFQAHGMARALFATALAQASAAVIALVFGLGSTESPPIEILALNGFFVALFIGSALLFRYGAREQIPAGTAQS